MEAYQFTAEQRTMLEKMQMPFAVYQFLDKRVVTLMLSDGFCELFGYTDKAEAYYDMDHNMYRDTHPDDVARIADGAFRFATEGGTYEEIYRTKNRERTGYIIVHAKGTHVYTDNGARLAYVWYTDEGPYEDGDGAGFTGSLDRVLKDESVIRATHYDYLTGLPSAAYFFELAEALRASALRSGEPQALLFIDLIGMKFFNRKHGFTEGNQLLREFARLLAIYFNNENCCRFGQDHFAVIAPADGVEPLLNGFFQDAMQINEGKSLPVRVGIYRFAEGENTGISTACDRARLACDTLRNVYSSHYKDFNETMRRDIVRKQYIIDNFDRAVTEGWIQVYYQPIVRAVNGRVCDEEALARWIDPENGLMAPAEFIPVLEDARLIHRLDLFVLETLLQKLKIQEEAGLYLVPQSVNLSRTDFEVCDIVEEIRRRVDDAGVSRSLVTIEITESVIGSDFDFIKEQIRRFRELGFSVWMDDFGSGYSSLDVLQSIAFDLIKFDISFMRRLDDSKRSRVVLTELMKMATQLGIDTVCEGVETQEQVRFLREIGCSKLQGFLYTPPIPLSKIIERYETGHQIGFEDPRQSGYYETIGRVDLYDLSILSGGEENAFRHIFETPPAAIIEICGDRVSLVRSNRAYREYSRRKLGFDAAEDDKRFGEAALGSAPFMGMLRHCCRTEGRSFIEDKLNDGTSIHIFALRVASDPVTGADAVAVVVLSIAEREEEMTYADLAHALAADYFNLFYVDLETEKFIEYTSAAGGDELTMERHGENFFAAARRDAAKMLHPADCAGFVRVFTKENVTHTLDTQGSFVHNYRLMQNGEPVYVSMKATRLRAGSKYIIIGVSSVDGQMKQKVAMEHLLRNQLVYSRVTALVGNFLILYTVDPTTEHYSEYSSTESYRSLGIAQEGEDFFATSRVNIKSIIHPDDLSRFLERFTRENVMGEIERNGLFLLSYRLLMGGEAKRVTLRAALTTESDGQKLLVGLNEAECAEQS